VTSTLQDFPCDNLAALMNWVDKVYERRLAAGTDTATLSHEDLKRVEGRLKWPLVVVEAVDQDSLSAAKRRAP